MDIKEFLWNGVWMFIWTLVTEVQIINRFTKQASHIKHMQWLRYVLIFGYLLAMIVAFIKLICSIFIVAIMVVVWIVGLLKLKNK